MDTTVRVKRFCCFYPEYEVSAVTPFALGEVDKTQFVHFIDTELMTLRVRADAMFWVVFKNIESDFPNDPHEFWKNLPEKWERCLNYINAFQLFLHHSTLLTSGHDIGCHDITQSDVIVHTGTSINAVGTKVTSRMNDPASPAFSQTMLIPKEAIELSVQMVTEASAASAVASVASLARSLAFNKKFDFRVSLVLAWFEIEIILCEMLKGYTAALDLGNSGEDIRFNGRRRSSFDKMSISNIIELLEVSGEIDISMYKTLTKCRQARNNIVHGNKSVSVEDSESAIKLLISLIKKVYDIDVSVSFTRNMVNF